MWYISRQLCYKKTLLYHLLTFCRHRFGYFIDNIYKILIDIITRKNWILYNDKHKQVYHNNWQIYDIDKKTCIFNSQNFSFFLFVLFSLIVCLLEWVRSLQLALLHSCYWLSRWTVNQILLILWFVLRKKRKINESFIYVRLHDYALFLKKWFYSNY